MATIGALSRAVASATGIHPTTVSVQARELRNSGWITKQERGFGAAAMTALDAAHLLTAAAFAGGVKDTVASVERLSQMRGRAMPKPTWTKANFESDLERNLSPQTSFIDVMVTIMDLTAGRRLFPDWSLPENFAGTGALMSMRSAEISVQYFRPVEAAAVMVSANRFFFGLAFGPLADVPIVWNTDIRALYRKMIAAPACPDGFVLRSNEIDASTFDRIARVLQDEDEWA